MSNRTGSKGFGKLEEGLRQASDWYLWGPYVSERQWGTVREDYSADGEAWDYLPHDLARSQAYRWGEDGLAGFCDVEQRLCLGLALWNGRDPILKERAYGLTGAEANHGEDVKEYWWYLDAVPSHAWNRWRYHYPQGAFPYENLREENGRRGKTDPEYELLDTGVFDDDRYWVVEVHYAKADPHDLLMSIQITNAGPGGRHAARAAHRLVSQHLVVGGRSRKAGAGRRRSGRGRIHHPFLGGLELLAGPEPGGGQPDAAVLRQRNQSRPALRPVVAARPTPRTASTTTWSAGAATVNPEQRGTKCAAWYRPTVAPGADRRAASPPAPARGVPEAGQRPRGATSTR